MGASPGKVYSYVWKSFMGMKAVAVISVWSDLVGDEEEVDKERGEGMKRRKCTAERADLFDGDL